MQKGQGVKQQFRPDQHLAAGEDDPVERVSRLREAIRRGRDAAEGGTNYRGIVGVNFLIEKSCDSPTASF